MSFEKLSPQLILQSVENAGFLLTGRYQQLNSYENRVFDLELEAKEASPIGSRVIAKYYRPGRWSEAALRDEHEFLQDLQHEGIPAVAPLQLNNHSTLKYVEPYWMTLFPRVVGRMPQEFLPGDLKRVGRLLARIHNVGSLKPAKNRIRFGDAKISYALLEKIEKFIFPEVKNAYFDAAETLIEYLQEELQQVEFLRIHGDCHRGNLLDNGKEYFIVDFDDFCNGPAIQDFWLLLSDRAERAGSEPELDELCEGYSELREVPDQWYLAGPLRAHRILTYAGWIASRWDDPSFPRLFPQFQTYNYWAEELNHLEQVVNQL